MANKAIIISHFLRYLYLKKKTKKKQVSKVKDFLYTPLTSFGVTC